MSSRTANWMMAAGALVMFLGLCFLPSVFGEHSDPELLAPAVGLFSIGALALAGGIYLRARALRGAVEAGDFGKDSGSKRGRGGCDLCGSEAPAVHCKVHQLHLCGNCLAEHYDVRSCVYTPTTRTATSKNRRTMAAMRGT